MDFSTTVQELADTRLDHTDLAIDDQRVAVEVGTRGTVTLIFGDELRFHQNLGLPDGIVDATGELTKDGCRRLEAFLRTLLADKADLDTSTLEVNNEDQSFVLGDEPGYAVVMPVQLDPSTTLQVVHDKIAWPFFASMINVCDPGTNNWPYLFNNV